MKCKQCNLIDINKRQKKYCSMVCTNLAKRNLQNARKYPKFGLCFNCKIQFKKDRPKHIFCSRKCYWESEYISKNSKETQQKRVSDKNHNFYVDGKTPEKELIRKRCKYKKWRTSVFKRDKYTCVWCGLKFIKGKTGRITLQADHIKPFCNYPELRFDINNGRTLCIDCHKKTDTFGIKAMKF